jgi:hypothetical protein
MTVTINCHICNRPYEPDPDKVQAWADSGRRFEPTDWECEECDVILSFLDDEAQRWLEEAYA